MVKIRVFFDTSTLTGLKSVGVRAVLSLKSVNMYLGELFHTIAVNGKTVKHWHFWSILYRSSPRCMQFLSFAINLSCVAEGLWTVVLKHAN